MDLTQPRLIVEYGPGEGCHTREIVRRMHPDSQVLLFELDPELAEHLQRQFRHESRVTILNADAVTLQAELAKRGHSHCDYVVSGIPFSLLGVRKKRDLLQRTYHALAPRSGAAFITYQMTSELVGHCRHFARFESEYCLPNIPPMFVLKFYRMANGHARPANGHSIGLNGNALNGYAKHDSAAT
jgi:phospholipid N-methyltransferase